MGKHRREGRQEQTLKRILEVAKKAALAKGASEHEAQEVAQITAFKIWRDRDRAHIKAALTWADDERLDSYVRTAARNTHFDLVRAHQRRIRRQIKAALPGYGESVAEQARADTPDTPAEVLQLLARSLLAEEIMKLPPKQRRVAALVYLEDRSIREVAELMDIQSQTVRKQLRAAKAKLADVLSEALRQDY